MVFFWRKILRNGNIFKQDDPYKLEMGMGFEYPEAHATPNQIRVPKTLAFLILYCWHVSG